MVTIRAPGCVKTVTSSPPIKGWCEEETSASRKSKNTESCVCPLCGMRYQFQDGILYPQSHNKNGTCDACHLEELIGNITVRKPLHHITNMTITKPTLKKQMLIPERKQRLIKSVAETLGGFALSRQEIGAVIDLCNDVEITIELEQEAPKDNRVAEVLTSARQRLVDYISNLGLEKCHDLYSMMLLGRNLDYYGLCQEAVVEFKLRTNENVSVAEVVQAMKPEKIAKRRDLKNWIQLVLDLVE